MQETQISYQPTGNVHELIVEYEIAPSEPDVGIMGAYADVQKVSVYFKGRSRSITPTQKILDHIDSKIDVNQDYDDYYDYGD